MARIYPSIEKIKELKPKPTAGELILCEYLKDNLDDNYEVFFQAMLNGYFPDVVILKKNIGMMIIEVKDWDLSCYEIDNKDWFVIPKNKAKSKIKSPFDQVNCYKNQIPLLSTELFNARVKTKKAYALIGTSVYFHNATCNQIKEVTKTIDKYNFCFNNEMLKQGEFENILSSCYLGKQHTKSRMFTEKMYKELKKMLLPSMHTLEKGIDINFTQKQKQLTESKSGSYKIKGVAGSGKTLVLASRAVNAHKRTKSRVLILTYNITLRNYIHDCISNVREDFCFNNFHINHYHLFIIQQLNIAGIYPSYGCFENVNIFKGNEDKIEKYDTILIDEVQDYKTEWLDIIKKYFLKESGEYVLFGDEKQNIYGRELDGKLPTVNVKGRWNELKESFRLKGNIVDLANEFQKLYFEKKYIVDSIEKSAIQLDFYEQQYRKTEKIEYYNFTNDDEILNFIIKKYNELTTHPNDICILAPKIEFLRDINEVFSNARIETCRTFESQKEYEIYCNHPYDEGMLEKYLEEIRRSYKMRFWMGAGMIKLSSIHSFKGWEIDTLFLVIDESNNTEAESSLAELIYTGFTRCKRHLIIINKGLEQFDSFFKDNIAN